MWYLFGCLEAFQSLRVLVTQLSIVSIQKSNIANMAIFGHLEARLTLILLVPHSNQLDLFFGSPGHLLVAWNIRWLRLVQSPGSLIRMDRRLTHYERLISSSSHPDLFWLPGQLSRPNLIPITLTYFLQHKVSLQIYI